MTSDPHDPNNPSANPPRGDSESVVGSDSALGLASPPPEEMSSGSSIFDHHVRTAPTTSAEGTPNLMRGERVFTDSEAAAAEESAETPTADAAAEEPEEAPQEVGEDIAESEASAQDSAAEAEQDSTSPPDEEPGAAASEWGGMPQEETVSSGDEELLSTPDLDNSVAEEEAAGTEFAVAGEGDGTSEHAEEFAGAEETASSEEWATEPAFETAAEALPGSEADPAAPSVSSDDDQDALAGIGALAGGAVAGAALADESPWSTDTTSTTSDSSSGYRPPSPPAAPKRDFVKLLLISYAVLSTVAAGLLWKRLNDRSVNEQRLESLPDVRTLNVGQVSTFDANINLPPGHQLKLGEKRRFGNLEVEATKVTRGMVTFEHPAGERWTLLPEGPVVKLWLRFRNVSKDQPIPPLDKYLVFSKTRIPGTEHFRTNSVVTTAADRRPVGYVMTHDHADKNILKGQQLNVDVPPGGTLETFIPLTPELDLPTGELLWRVHMRKGFGKAGAGVTTLIEVAFSAKDIVDDGQG